MVAVNRARSKVKRLDLHGAYWLNRFTVFKVSDPHGGAPHGLFARNGALYGATGAGGVHDCYTSPDRPMRPHLSLSARTSARHGIIECSAGNEHPMSTLDRSRHAFSIGAAAVMSSVRRIAAADRRAGRHGANDGHGDSRRSWRVTDASRSESG